MGTRPSFATALVAREPAGNTADWGRSRLWYGFRLMKLRDSQRGASEDVNLARTSARQIGVPLPNTAAAQVEHL